MNKVLMPTMIAGILIFSMPVFILTHLNWNDEIYAKFLSAIVVGVGTLAVTVLISLNGSAEKVIFMTTIVLDKSKNLPPTIDGQTSVARRLMRLKRSSNPTRLVEGKAIKTVKAPKTTDEQFQYCGQLLQYSLIQDIFRLQKTWTSTSSTREKDGPLIIRPFVHFLPSVNNRYKLSGRDVYLSVKENPFANGDSEQTYWENTSYVLPDKTEVAAGPTESNNDEYGIFLLKPNYFSYYIRIIPDKTILEPFSIPSGINLPSERVKTWKTFVFQIQIESRVERWTSGSQHSKEFKEWMRSLTKAIELRWSESHNEELSAWL